jgi:hypothetical protein
MIFHIVCNILPATAAYLQPKVMHGSYARTFLTAIPQLEAPYFHIAIASIAMLRCTKFSRSMLEMSTGVTDFCKFIVSIGAGATADSSIVLFS